MVDRASFEAHTQHDALIEVWPAAFQIGNEIELRIGGKNERVDTFRDFGDGEVGPRPFVPPSSEVATQIRNGPPTSVK